MREMELTLPASLRVEGPDERGHVWACAEEGCEVWCQNLGPVELVAEMMPECLHLMHSAENG